jgi:DNA-binding FadR family transcriptional regulator
MPLPLQDRILQHLRELELLPGEPIPTEQSLATSLDVSRAALREALAALEAFGVVNTRQGARRTLGEFNMAIVVRKLAQTMQPSTQVLLELLDVRRVLEVAFFPVAVANMSVKKVRELRSIVDRMRSKASRGEPFLEEDAEFHQAIYAHLDNKTLEGLLGAFWQMFEQTSSDNRTGHDLPESARSHARIVEALELGDTALGVHQLNVHFFDVRSRLTTGKAVESGLALPPSVVS